MTVRPGMLEKSDAKNANLSTGNYSGDLEEHRAHNLLAVEANRQSNSEVQRELEPKYECKRFSSLASG